MPLREYECQTCHRRIEKIKSFSAPPETICPTCGGTLEQTLSAPALQFKGSGWYVNDYANNSSKASRTSDAAKESGSPEAAAAATSAAVDKTAAPKSGAAAAGAAVAAAAPSSAPSSSPATSSSAKPD